MKRNNEKERVKISRNRVSGRDVSISPYSPKLSIPKSIAVDCSDRSLSSMDDSSRPFIHDNRSPPPGIVTATRRKNNLFKVKSSRSVTNSPASCSRTISTNVRTDSKTTVDQTSSASPTPRKFARAASCRVVTEPKTTDVHVDQKKTSSGNRGRNVSARKYMRSSSCLFGSSSNNSSLSPYNGTTVSTDSNNETSVKPTRFLKKLRRVSSCCDIVNEGRVRDTVNNSKSNNIGPKSRFDSPIIGPTASPSGPMTNIDISTSLQHHQQQLVDSVVGVVVGRDGKQQQQQQHHHHLRDKPPTSPRRYITPTRATSFQSRAA